MRLAAWGAVWLGFAAAWYFAGTIPGLAWLPSLVAFAFMAWFFGRTLRAGSEPLITRIARKTDSDMTPEVAKYTRTLTGVWSACFAILFVVTLLAAFFLPANTGLPLVQLLGIAVPVALFAGEHAYRPYRFPHRRRASLVATLRNIAAVFRDDGGKQR